MHRLRAVDTAARSLAHWSEEGRAEMDAFYALARRDYERLAGAFVNHPAWLRRVADGRRRITAHVPAQGPPGTTEWERGLGVQEDCHVIGGALS